MDGKLGIYLGALSKSIFEQVNHQMDQSFNESDFETFQKDADAIVRLYMRGMITDSEKTKAGKRFVKLLIKYIEDDLLDKS